MKKITLFLCLVWSSTLVAQLNMSLLSNWDGSSVGYNDVWGYVDDFDNEYAIIGSRTHTYFIDITDSANPVEIANFDGSFGTTITGASTTWRDFKTFKRFAYGVCDSCGEGLSIYDLTDIANGNVIKTNQLNDVFTSCHNIYIDVPNGKLYAVGGTMGNKVAVYDLEIDPANPVLLANVTVDGGYIHDIFVQDNIAYGSSGYDGIYILDMSDPSNPLYMASLNTGGYNHSNWITEDGTKLIIAEEVPQGLPLIMVDISDAQNDNLIELNRFHEPLEAPLDSSVTYHNPYIVDNFAVISSYNDGITIFDISNPLDTNLVAYYDTYSGNNGSYNGYNGCWGSYPFLPSGTILGSDRATGLYVLSTTVNITTECFNGTLDKFERGIDCGGFCKPCATCDDGIQNGDEENIDCGGATCVPCETDIVCEPYIAISGVETDTTYYSSGIIKSEALVPVGTDVIYKGAEISLRAFFEVELNAEFLATIDPCSSVLPSPSSVVTQSYKNTTIKESIEEEQFKMKVLRTEDLMTIEINVPEMSKEAFLFINKEDGTSIQKIQLENNTQNLIKLSQEELIPFENQKLFLHLYTDQFSKTKEFTKSK